MVACSYNRDSLVTHWLLVVTTRDGLVIHWLLVITSRGWTRHLIVECTLCVQSRGLLDLVCVCVRHTRVVEGSFRGTRSTRRVLGCAVRIFAPSWSHKEHESCPKGAWCACLVHVGETGCTTGIPGVRGARVCFINGQPVRVLQHMALNDAASALLHPPAKPVTPTKCLEMRT